MVVVFGIWYLVFGSCGLLILTTAQYKRADFRLLLEAKRANAINNCFLTMVKKQIYRSPTGEADHNPKTRDAKIV